MLDCFAVAPFSNTSRTNTVVQCLGKLVEHIGIHKVIAVAFALYRIYGS
jgi:hypothetical protein